MTELDIFYFNWIVFVLKCCDIRSMFWFDLFAFESLAVCFYFPLTCPCQTLLLCSFQSLHLHLFWWMTLRSFSQRHQVKCVCPFILTWAWGIPQKITFCTCFVIFFLDFNIFSAFFFFKSIIILYPAPWHIISDIVTRWF